MMEVKEIHAPQFPAISNFLSELFKKKKKSPGKNGKLESVGELIFFQKRQIK